MQVPVMFGRWALSNRCMARVVRTHPRSQAVKQQVRPLMSVVINTVVFKANFPILVQTNSQLSVGPCPAVDVTSGPAAQCNQCLPCMPDHGHGHGHHQHADGVDMNTFKTCWRARAGGQRLSWRCGTAAALCCRLRYQWIFSHAQIEICPTRNGCGCLAVLVASTYASLGALSVHSRHLLQTFSGVDLKHQFRAAAPGPPRVTAPVTTTVLPRLLLQHPGVKP